MPEIPSREMVATALLMIERACEDNADGWGVVVIDTETGEAGSFYGPFHTPEEALVQAADFDRDPHSGTAPADGSPGWKHVVVPMFNPPTKRRET